MRNRSLKLYFTDILSSINNIEKYTKGMSREGLADDQKTYDAVIRNLEIIGEAVNNLPKQFTVKHKDIPWNKIISMRNKIIHEYFGVDEEILWQTINEDLPFLKTKIAILLKQN